MFVRGKFVTNSSSTSFVGFGICLDNDEIDKLRDYLVHEYAEEAYKMVQEEYLEEFWEDYLRDPATFIMEEGLTEDLADMVLKDLQFQSPYGDDSAYILIGMPNVQINEEGRYYLLDPDSSKKGFMKLKEIMSSLGIEKEIELITGIQEC
jgi:hypothetical protein